MFPGSTDLSILDVPIISPQSSDRWRRSHKPGHLPDPEWPPKSNENWLEILVVADGPMVKYHGDKLQNYILTLMQIVSFLHTSQHSNACNHLLSNNYPPTQRITKIPTSLVTCMAKISHSTHLTITHLSFFSA